MKRPVVLMILDGFGIAKTEGNAIAAAKRPNLDKLFSENPITKIGASGMDVGLPHPKWKSASSAVRVMGFSRLNGLPASTAAIATLKWASLEVQISTASTMSQLTKSR